MGESPFLLEEHRKDLVFNFQSKNDLVKPSATHHTMFAPMFRGVGEIGVSDSPGICKWVSDKNMSPSPAKLLSGPNTAFTKPKP